MWGATDRGARGAALRRVATAARLSARARVSSISRNGTEGGEGEDWTQCDGCSAKEEGEKGELPPEKRDECMHGPVVAFRLSFSSGAARASLFD